MNRTTRLSAAVVCGALITTAAATTTTSAPAGARQPRHAVYRLDPHIIGRKHRHNGSAQQSLNWSGYIRAGKQIHAATASWTVPKLAPGHDGYSSTWVGIDGATAGDSYLIQTGTEADALHGRTYYRAWWEVITPDDVAPETLFSGFLVHPGDPISASVRRLASGRWTMRLTDGATHRTASHTAVFGGSGASAEWIQEDTDVNGSISTAPNWGAVTFRRLTVNGTSPHLSAAEAVDIVDRKGIQETATSAPTRSGSGFTVTWRAGGSATSTG